MIRFLVPAATAALTAGFASGWFIAASLYPAKPPTIEELRDQGWTPPSAHDRDVIARNTKFNSARSVIRHDHPDIPHTIEFPEIATNPVLWDFTLHSVLRGERRTWTWGYTRYVAVAPTITTTGTGAVYPAGTISTDTTIATGNGPSITWAGSCSIQDAYGTIIMPSLIPAASGGRP